MLNNKIQNIEKLSAKEVILRHLKLNRGREVPISEFRDEYGLKSSTISNAMKELKLKRVINVEKRHLRRGRYTVITLVGDSIVEQYFRADEKQPPSKPKVNKTKVLNADDLEGLTKLLLDNSYSNFYLDKTVNSFGLTDTQLILRLMTPLMRKVGTDWSTGTLTISEEHIISYRIETYLRYLIAQQTKEKERGTIVLVPAEGEEHVLPLIFLEFLFNPFYQIINLGYKVPTEDFLTFLKKIINTTPVWIFFSLVSPLYSSTLIKQVKFIHENLGDHVQIAIGGQGTFSLTPEELNDVDLIVSSDEDLENLYQNLMG